MNGDSRSGFIVADDHPLLRQGIRIVLESAYPNDVVVEAPDFDTTLAAVVARPDAILLIDLDMPGMNGVESLRALRLEFPALRMAVLSANAERQIIVDALKVGVNGYILKASPPEELLYAVATIQSGHVYLNAVLSQPATELTGTLPAPKPIVEPQTLSLTPRQHQVLEWLMKGHSNKQIARDLSIGEGTTKIHLAAIFRVLGAQNRTEAVMIASRLRN